jgi:hypothetical protein
MHLAAQTTSVVEGPITDPRGLAITGAEITLSGPALAREIRVMSDAEGSFRIPGLPAGIYSLRVGKPGFATQVSERLEVLVNRVLDLSITLPVSTVQEVITVSADPPLIETKVSSSGATILPQQIAVLPLNGRNYLDLMQIVPGVTVNRRVDKGTDDAVPMLGERGGNAVYLIDGMPNSNGIDGGPAAPFDQDSILEFQVLTAGYQAEFGHGSGGVVNVVSKSGTSEWHGLASAFHRDNTLDSSDIPGATAPFLHRWDLSANLAGPLHNDRMFFFGSVERIRETRELNFAFPPQRSEPRPELHLPQVARQPAGVQATKHVEQRGGRAGFRMRCPLSERLASILKIRVQQERAALVAERCRVVQTEHELPGVQVGTSGGQTGCLRERQEVREVAVGQVHLSG